MAHVVAQRGIHVWADTGASAARSGAFVGARQSTAMTNVSRGLACVRERSMMLHRLRWLWILTTWLLSTHPQYRQHRMLCPILLSQR
jgi:hypothetical protein